MFLHSLTSTSLKVLNVISLEFPVSQISEIIKKLLHIPTCKKPDLNQKSNSDDTFAGGIS